MSNLSDRAAFYLCLARAFRSPRERAAYDAIRLHLTGDLSDLAAALGYSAADALCELRAAVARVPGRLALLQGYSRLFLTPPVPVPLNAGVYLDGAIMGPSTLALEKCYLQSGVKPGSKFHDLPDHIVLQLEFAAFLYAAEAAGSAPALRAEDFLASFVRCWLPPFVAALEKSCRQEACLRVYLHLAQLLQIAVDHELRDYRPVRTDLHSDTCSTASFADSSRGTRAI